MPVLYDSTGTTVSGGAPLPALWHGMSVDGWQGFPAQAAPADRAPRPPKQVPQCPPKQVPQCRRPHPPQVVSWGSCIDGNVCNTWTGCANSVSKTKILPDEAWGSNKFSSVELVVAPGQHTYYVRQNNYMGCGGTLNDCFGSGEIQFQLIQSGRPDMALAGRPAAGGLALITLHALIAHLWSHCVSCGAAIASH